MWLVCGRYVVSKGGQHVVSREGYVVGKWSVEIQQNLYSKFFMFDIQYVQQY